MGSLVISMVLSCSGLLEELGCHEPGRTGWYLHSAARGLRNSSSLIYSMVQELLFAGDKKVTGKEIVNPDPAEWQTFAIKHLWLAPSSIAHLAEALGDAIQMNLDYEIDHQNADASWSPPGRGGISILIVGQLLKENGRELLPWPC